MCVCIYIYIEWMFRLPSIALLIGGAAHVHEVQVHEDVQTHRIYCSSKIFLVEQ